MEGGLAKCPCCFKECAALCMDACLSVKQHMGSAAASDGLPSFLPDPLFIPQSTVAHELGVVGELSAFAPSAPAQGCGTRFASAHASDRTKRSDLYHRQGMSGTMCRYASAALQCDVPLPP